MGRLNVLKRWLEEPQTPTASRAPGGAASLACGSGAGARRCTRQSATTATPSLSRRAAPTTTAPAGTAVQFQQWKPTRGGPWTEVARPDASVRGLASESLTVRNARVVSHMWQLSDAITRTPMNVRRCLNFSTPIDTSGLSITRQDRERRLLVR